MRNYIVQVYRVVRKRKKEEKGTSKAGGGVEGVMPEGLHVGGSFGTVVDIAEVGMDRGRGDHLVELKAYSE